jgi:crossover junction endodeoxyribonuclease RuvC
VAGKVVVLGIDPGSIITGFGVVETDGSSSRVIAWDCVKTSSRAPLPERLAAIYRAVVEQISSHRPDVIAVENVFQSKNVKSALKLGHARGVILLAAAQSGAAIHEYAPREVKQSVVGIGSASKAQVASMVRRLLDVGDAELAEDESDALGVALCYAHRMRSSVLKGSGR